MRYKIALLTVSLILIISCGGGGSDEIGTWNSSIWDSAVWAE